MELQAKSEREIVLSADGVKKRIGKKWIIHDVSFHVYAGEIFGFLGPNGSGKTTTIRMLVDLIAPTEGKVEICGYDVHRQPEQALRYVGCIVENPECYSYLTGWENLEHFARMMPDIGQERIAEVVSIVGMSERIHDKVRTYSLGMRQRLGIAQALLGRPRLLILDEPTNGLDPKGIKELREFVRMLASQGISLFISSHLLSEIQLMCDRVAIISQGRVRAVGDVGQLVAQAGGYVLWHAEPREQAERLLAELPGIRFVAAAESRIDESILGAMPEAIITTLPEEAVPAAVARLAEAGVGIRAVQRVAPTLEELFLRMTEGEGIA